MTNLREAYAATHHANLDWQEHERAIDRVAAAGNTDDLGLALWRAKYLSEAKGYRDARAGLIALYRNVIARFEQQDVVEKVVDQVLHEYLSAMCISCNGAKELMCGDLRVTCQACAGVGVRKYDDMSRARTMGLGFSRVRRLSRSMSLLTAEISARDTAVNAVIAANLERT